MLPPAESSTAAPVAKPPAQSPVWRSPRRWPGWVWVLMPLAIGLLYAAGHGLFAPKPQLANLPPPEAVLVQRYRNLDVLDRVSFGPRGPGFRAPRDIIGTERNVPGLPGVDHTAPLHLVLLPRGMHQDASMAIFKLEDTGAFEREFMRTDFVERKLIRHAQHLHMRGGYAAVGPNPDATRRIGRGTLTCEDLGEDYSIAADIPGLIAHAMQVAKQYPWRSILEALGLEPAKTTFVHDPASGAVTAVIPGAERVERIRTAWDTARLWGWMDAGRMRVDLVPSADGTVAKALAARANAIAAKTDGLQPPDFNNPDDVGATPFAPADAEAWMRVAWDYDRVFLAHALLACGVRFVEEGEGIDLLGGLGAPPRAREIHSRHAERGLLLWAAREGETGYAWTLGMAATHGNLPPLTAFLPALPKPGEQVDLPADAAPLTKGDTVTERETPKGTLQFARKVPIAAGDTGISHADVVTFGPDARKALEAMKNHLSLGHVPPRPAREIWDPGEGLELVGEAFLRGRRAPKVLGKALEEGGFLAPLAGGDIRAALYTDGRMLRLLMWREGPQ